MKVSKSILAVWSALSCLAGAGHAGEPAHAAPARTNAIFEALKPLVGGWQGSSDEGKPVTISYALVSGGSALVETLETGKDPGMVTVYYPDGDRLMMTHYCSLHNQPRMRATAPPAVGGKLPFEFVDATNLTSPDAMHMHRLVVTLVDKDHIVQEWTWKHGEKEGTTAFRLERKKGNPP
jgi:hypothetical protein